MPNFQLQCVALCDRLARTLRTDTLLGRLRRSTLLDAARGAVLLAAAAGATGISGGLGGGYAARVLLLFCVAMTVVFLALPAHLPQPRFGAANRVTMARLALVAMLAALLGEPARVHSAMAWAVVALASVAALLDAADGALARARRTESAFGARFDMETDALLILVLSALALHADKAGGWILAAGALRYLFVAAARPLPWMARPLPASTRRKVVCVVQIVSLIVCLAPVVATPWSAVIAAGGLAVLLCSFAIDVRWLARHR